MIQIKNLIIGGGFIDPQLEKSLKAFPNKIYSSYGMTETLSHIAVRQLNGEKASEYYQPFGSVKISLSEENTLIIDAPLVSNEKLITNDIAKIKKDGSFLVIGRKDNVINSGGVKVQPELIEEVLKPSMNGIFAISAVSDEKLGEAVVLVIEKDIKAEIDIFHPHYKPKKIIKIPSIPLTETGKINRYKLKQLLQK